MAQENDTKDVDHNISRLKPGIERGVWRYAKVTRATLIIDAANYFAVMQAAMLNAKFRILLIGWDFDTRIHLATGRSWWQRGWSKKYPARLGSFIAWLSRNRPALEIRILKWSFGAFKFALRGSMWWDLVRWFPHRRIDFKFDSAHPVGCSHHQKLAVLDSTLAVCGGIDMTTGRWDTRDHEEDNPDRKNPDGDTYEPWHDASMMMEGPIATALSELGQDRWIRAGGEALVDIEPRKDSLWPEGLEIQFENVEFGIARTRAAYRDWDKVDEIEDLFCVHIERAQKFIYAESQYFASRVIAEAMLARLQEENPPEIVIVHPRHADGWLEQQAMDHARAQLVDCLRTADEQQKFSIWTPYSGETSIYVHAKIMIVDDEILRIGSANMNNRSLGLDSECDVFLDTAREANAHVGDQITTIRHSLLAEHCGVEEAEVTALLDKHGSMRAMIEAECQTGGRHLRAYEVPDLSELEEKLATSQLLDPESPDELFEPFANGGMFRKQTRLSRIKHRIARRLTK